MGFGSGGEPFDVDGMWQGLQDGLLQGVTSIGLNYLTQELDLDPLLANIGFSIVSSGIEGLINGTGIFENVASSFINNTLSMMGYNPMPVLPQRNDFLLSQLVSTYTRIDSYSYSETYYYYDAAGEITQTQYHYYLTPSRDIYPDYGAKIALFQGYFSFSNTLKTLYCQTLPLLLTADTLFFLDLSCEKWYKVREDWYKRIYDWYIWVVKEYRKARFQGCSYI